MPVLHVAWSNHLLDACGLKSAERWNCDVWRTLRREFTPQFVLGYVYMQMWTVHSVYPVGVFPQT